MAHRLDPKLLARYRIIDGKDFRLKDHDPADVAPDLVDHRDSEMLLKQGVRRLAELQPLLYAHHSWSLLCVFQAIDAAGKDSTISHVMTGVNPQGVQVTSFKVPGPEALDHGFLWRISRALPPRGHIGIFNRSHYEEVLVPRVHAEVLERQHLPERLVTKKIWQHRLADIAAFERYLSRQGMVILKFFLHLSRAEQKRRFLDRMDEPWKNWKFSPADVAERGHWDEYMAAYEEAIAATADERAPWFVVPADNKWFTWLVVVQAMIEALEELELKAPALPPEDEARLADARRLLEEEKD
jgi:PPK2 family polyphosphate:nucleotide phosphotransferase